MNRLALALLVASIGGLARVAESASTDDVPFEEKLATTAYDAGVLDLTNVWYMTKPQTVKVAYSAVGWEVEPVEKGATVDLQLTESGAAASKAVAEGLTGRGMTDWRPTKMNKSVYTLDHVVKDANGQPIPSENLRATFSFVDYEGGSATRSEIAAALYVPFTEPYDFANDAENPWEVIGEAGEGMMSPADGEHSVFTLKVEDVGTLSFETAVAGGTLTIALDGAVVATIADDSDWTARSVLPETRGSHTVTLTFDQTGGGVARLKGVTWVLKDVDFGTVASDPVAVDLREGIRVIRRSNELLPFTYSLTNFTGVAGVPDEVRVRVVRLTGTDPDISTWTDEVPGTERVLRTDLVEGKTEWYGNIGVWKAEFRICGGGDVLHLETAIFDMRRFAAGLMILVQ